MSIKKAIASGMFLEQKKEETVQFLANNIAETFQLLANIEPAVALSVVEQLNEQFNEEIADELIESRNEQLERVAGMVNISESDLDD